ncbi:FtsH protease activity modulator HflK [Sphingomonas montanisoli]|uniref:Protein HflK n=1 Tax=Sphingomonas montanisoli TaxID=2606412 RepID=A0A5D9BZB9_9SPHN|nr:FtsH protease activity modulator HflK [Sphingomonas montanisoli]TZG24938.1 FtsH protease activity modulator HflK [Sphingomonas montanisoli]
MNTNDDAGARPIAVMNEGGPWGGGSGNNGGSGGGDNDRNPWNQPPRRKPAKRAGNPAIDDLLRRGRERFGGGGDGSGIDPDGGKLIAWAIAALIILWVALTSWHVIGPQQRGVVTRLGAYAETLQPGLRFHLPAPFDIVDKIDVEDIRTTDIGSTSEGAQNLVLTGDQNIIDLAYSVRWNIRDPELYLYELADPDDTVGEVAESAMRAELARVSLNDAIGPQRSQIEQRTAQRMQEILDSYRAGIVVQGVAIKQADPPAAVNDAFKSVSAAQQTAQTYLNEARAYAQQLGAKAEGESAAFDKVYTEYRLAPEVTRKRMYYETMERVLAKTDKTVIEGPNVVPYMPLPAPRRPEAAQ